MLEINSFTRNPTFNQSTFSKPALNCTGNAEAKMKHSGFVDKLTHSHQKEQRMQNMKMIDEHK